MTMSREFIDRIFIEIDSAAIKLEKIAKIAYINSTNIEVIKKIIFIIIAFIILSSLGMIYNTETIISKHNIVTHKQTIPSTIIVEEPNK